MVEVILVPTDLSPHSVAALEHAVALARQLEAKLLLLYVKSARIQVLPAPLGRPGPDAWERAELLRLQERLLGSGVECEVQMAEGHPAIAIAEAARTLGADLIVMGTRGIGGVMKVFFRSVSEEICRSAPCPVTVVRNGLSSAVSLRHFERDLCSLGRAD